MNLQPFSKISNKQNQASIQAIKPTTKTMNFGKAVKYKAHVPLLQSPTLKQNQTIINKDQSIQAFYNLPTPKLQHFRSPSFQEDDLLKSKIVRFEDEEQQISSSQVSLQLSRSKKKNATSILKKTPSLDKLSVNSGNSDLGQMDYLNPKNSLKDKGGLCSNDKYLNQVKMLKYQNIKFFDNLFPPGGSSLCYSKSKIAQFKNVRWMRIQDIYKGKKLTVFNENNYSKCIYNKGPLGYGTSLAVACNALSNSNRCLQRIFEEQTVTGLCIYYLRINQDGIWKYTMIDDYIPVIKQGRNDVPAFMSVSQNQFGEIQIWPLLIQKAFAKIYNCYQSLFNDNVYNFLYDLTGFPPQQLNLQDQRDQFKFRSNLTHCQTVSVISDPYNKQFFQDEEYPIREEGGMTSSAYFNLDVRMRLMDLKRYSNLLIDVGDIRKQFKKANIFTINETYYSLGCIIKQAKNTISLRKFSIKQRTANCILSLIQKDKKYYQNNGYDYVWSRIMVVMKDGANGYRWIDGKYLKARILSLYLNLQPGQYFVLAIGDWKTRAFQMFLNYQGNQQIQFRRQSTENYPNILSQACVDISQRFGVLKQITKSLCSYRLIDRKNGFIIQNVNNQVNRPIIFHKSYSLRDKHKYLQEQQNWVQTKIKPNSHFTFIAKLIDGFDPQLFDHFTFD